uniref:Uncharacterized protein n=1 Tax=Romanomermis culicivorax TaxID=13658 RepID=A0A915HWG1_ROMCU
MDGYESEPPYSTFRIFETSARQLNECRPAPYYANNHHQQQQCLENFSVDNHQEQYYGFVANRNVNSECGAAAGSSAPVSRRAMPTFSAAAAAQSRGNEDIYFGKQSDAKIIDDSCGSPTFNIITPEPLKLDNIEYLLRELNRNPSISSSSSIENDLIRNRQNNSMSRSCAANRYSDKNAETRQNNDDSLLNSTPESNNLDFEEEKSSRYSTINRRPIKFSENEEFNTLTAASHCVLDHHSTLTSNRRFPAINHQQQK